MIDTPTHPAPDGGATTADLARSVHEHCERALRRLRVLARERNDVLLSQALRSVNRAAQISAAQMREPTLR